MERIFLIWWALVLGIGLVGLMVAGFELIGKHELSARAMLGLASAVLVAGAAWMCPTMLWFEYDPMVCGEGRYAISWLLLAASASTVLAAIRTHRSRRVRQYLKQRESR